MSKKLDKQQEETLRQEFEKGLKAQFRNGLAQGVYSVSKVIHDKAADESLPAEERLNEIIRFCKISIDVNKAKASSESPDGGTNGNH